MKLHVHSEGVVLVPENDWELKVTKILNHNLGMSCHIPNPEKEVWTEARPSLKVKPSIFTGKAIYLGFFIDPETCPEMQEELKEVQKDICLKVFRAIPIDELITNLGGKRKPASFDGSDTYELRPGMNIVKYHSWFKFLLVFDQDKDCFDPDWNNNCLAIIGRLKDSMTVLSIKSSEGQMIAEIPINDFGSARKLILSAIEFYEEVALRSSSAYKKLIEETKFVYHLK